MLIHPRDLESRPVLSRLRSRAAPLLGALILVTALTPAVASPVAATGGSELVAVANKYRAAAGKGPVSVHSTINQIAVERARQLVRGGQLVHDFDYIMRRLGEENVCWQAVGEIIAFNSSGSYDRFGEQWYNSTTHRNIMLGGYTHAGGARESGGSVYYGVMIFVKLCGATTPAPTIAGFTDIGSSVFQADIKWLVDENITGGCGPSSFCPRSSVAREQMASFLRRGLGLASASKDYYWDDGASAHQDDINRMAEAALTAGCGTSRYCPGANLSRGQMASFLVRALSLPPTRTDFFRDDNGSMHEDAINRLAAANIAGGCASGLYCPASPVSREQMAAFLHRSLGD